ncbi:hypothetical protein AB7M23_001300 [Pseudomonas sp. HLS-6 TE3448]
MSELRRQLDDIASDTINYDCDVLFQVPRKQDYPWLATLLSKRVHKLAPDFALQQRHEIHRNQPAQVVLTPRRP